jgi:hypothetical protein
MNLCELQGLYAYRAVYFLQERYSQAEFIFAKPKAV